MATYVPNANQTTEPAASQPVESAALEFRTLKTHAVQFNTTDAETSKTRLPADTIRAGKYLAFDSLGRPIAADSLPATLYLGAFDVAPVTRNSGEVLATGDLYFNTVDTRMWVYDIVAGWVNYELNTQTSATAAAASAGASATSASAALTSEQNADVSEASALAAKVAAESARDAANAVGKVFTTTALGIAGTTSGESFSVLSADLLDLIVYTNAAGTATELFRFKTKGFFDSVFGYGYSSRTGYIHAWVDSSGALLLGIKSDGTLWSKGSSVNLAIENAAAAIAYVNNAPLNIKSSIELDTALQLSPAAIHAGNIDFLTQSANIFNLSTAVVGNLDTVTGGDASTAGWNRSVYIPVLASTQYSIGPSGHVCFYDVSKNFISSTGASVILGAFTTPALCRYIRIDSSEVISAVQVALGATVPASFVPYGFTLNPAKKVLCGSPTPWAGKKWAVLGDSMTLANVYPPLVAASTGLSISMNLGVGGLDVKGMDDSLTVGNMADIDLVTIFGLTNDYGGNRAVGTIADAYTGSVVASFYNDVYQVLANILTLKPSVRIMFFTSPKRGAFSTGPVYPAANGSGYYMEQYVNAVKEVCAIFAVPVCDIFSISGICPANISSMTVDNLHPTTAGYARIAEIISAFVNAA